MLKTIEKATNHKELFKIYKKYNILPTIMQPSAVLSQIAEELYKKDGKVKYAVCDCDAKIEIVQYETMQELKDYCKKENFEMIIQVKKDGGGLVSRLEHL